MFTDSEQNYIREMIRLSGIAKKHGVTTRYVDQILRGDRAVRSEKAKKIAADLKKVAEEMPEHLQDPQHV